MTEGSTEQISELWEEIEGKLFHVSLIDDQEYDTWEWVFSEELRDAVIEEGLEGKIHEYIYEDTAWELIEKEVEVVSEETQPTWVFGNDVSWSVIELMIKFSRALL